MGYNSEDNWFIKTNEATVKVDKGEIEDWWRKMREISILELSKKQIETLDLYFFQNRSSRQTAKTLGISRQTVQLHMERAMQTLRKINEVLGIEYHEIT